MNGSKPKVDRPQTFNQQPVHELVHVGNAFVNVHARMAARTTRQANAKLLDARLDGFRFIGARGSDIDSTGASDGQFIVVFCVEVEEDVTLQKPALQSQRAGHACLLIDGKQCVNGGVRDVCGVEHSQDGCHADAVVRSERGAFRTHPVAIHVHLDALGVKVEYGVRVLLAYHVEMALQDDVPFVFHSSCCRLADQHIANLIGEGFEAPIVSESDDPFADLLFLFRRPWNAIQCVEEVPQRPGFEADDAHGFFFKNSEQFSSPAVNSMRPPFRCLGNPIWV